MPVTIIVPACGVIPESTLTFLNQEDADEWLAAQEKDGDVTREEHEEQERRGFEQI